MSSIDTIECPRCKHCRTEIKGGYGWAHTPIVKCQRCGHSFDPVKNTVDSYDYSAEERKAEAEYQAKTKKV